MELHVKIDDLQERCVNGGQEDIATLAVLNTSLGSFEPVRTRLEEMDINSGVERDRDVFL